MPKIIKYQFIAAEISHDVMPEPYVEPIILEKIVACRNQEQFDAGYEIAAAEAIPETVQVFGEFDPVPSPDTTDAIWDELNAAYQNGVNSV